MAVVKGDWTQELRHWLTDDVIAKTSENGFILFLPCSACNISKEMHLAKRLPPQVIARKLREQGWKIGKKMTCPHCVKTRPAANKKITYETPTQTEMKIERPVAAKAPHTAPEPTTTDERIPILIEGPIKLGSLSELADLKLSEPEKLKLEHVEDEEPVSQSAEETTPQRSAAAKQAYRQVMSLLEEFFDEDRGSYRLHKGEPYSDEKIAKDTGDSVAYVKKIREEWFGPLKVPPEVEEIQLELQQLRRKQEDFEKSALAMSAAIKQQISTAESRLADLCRRSGWVRP